MKSRSSLLAPAHPGGPRKRAVKWLCVCVLCVVFFVGVWYVALLETSHAVSCVSLLVAFQKCLLVGRYKLLKWWAQSFLIGISKIVCGFRDDDGIVRQIREFHTSELPKQCRVLYWILCLWILVCCEKFCSVFSCSVFKVFIFYRVVHYSALHDIAIPRVCLSVSLSVSLSLSPCLSMTFVNCGYWGWHA